MAVQSIAKSSAFTVKLDAGTDALGHKVTRSVTVSKLAPNPDGEKIYAVVDKLAPCLVHSVSGVEVRTVKTLEKV